AQSFGDGSWGTYLKADPSLRARSARFAQDDMPGRVFLKREIGCHPMVIGLLLFLQLGTPPVYDRVLLGGHWWIVSSSSTCPWLARWRRGRKRSWARNSGCRTRCGECSATKLGSDVGT